jgi:hypothetical protein
MEDVLIPMPRPSSLPSIPCITSNQRRSSRPYQTDQRVLSALPNSASSSASQYSRLVKHTSDPLPQPTHLSHHHPTCSLSPLSAFPLPPSKDTPYSSSPPCPPCLPSYTSGYSTGTASRRTLYIWLRCMSSGRGRSVSRKLGVLVVAFIIDE